jgi:hypothetical protein
MLPWVVNVSPGWGHLGCVWTLSDLLGRAPYGTAVDRGFYFLGFQPHLPVSPAGRSVETMSSEFPH